MKILIFEYFSSGGKINNKRKPDLIREGQLILSHILRSFYLPTPFAGNSGEKGSGTKEDITIETVLNQRVLNHSNSLDKNKFPTDKLNIINSNKITPDNFADLLQGMDAVLITAPETNDILRELTAVAHQLGVTLLSPGAATVAKAGDKWLSHQLLQKTGLPQPVAAPLSRLHKRKAAADLPSDRDPVTEKFLKTKNTPHNKKSVLIKKRDGAGSDILLKAPKSRLFNPDYHLNQTYLEKQGLLNKVTEKSCNLIIENYREGLSASISLISNGKEVVPLSLNRQLLSKKDFKYRGGIINIQHDLKQKIYKDIQKLPEIFEEFRGYLGIDLILQPEKYFIVDINPRLTTSILGLIPPLPLGPFLVRAATSGQLPPPSALNIPVSNKFKLKNF